MPAMKFFLLSQFLLLCCLFSECVKIGVSKPLATNSTATTTIAPATTTIDSNNAENVTDSSLEIDVSTTNETTTLKTVTTEESEWPEFPPRKKTTIRTTTTTTTTTKIPKTTSKKTAMTSTTAMPSTEDTNANKNETDLALDTSYLFVQARNNDKYCFCDMTAGMCDINCCCDAECTVEALRVFKCLQEQTRDFEIHEGRFEDFKFQHGLPSCEVNDGWLCVFRTNIPPVVEKVPPNYSDTSLYYKWPNMLRDDKEDQPKDFFMYEDVLKLINMETRDVKNFDLPASLKPPLCQGKEPIFHLKYIQLTCLLSGKGELEEIESNFLELSEKHKILRKPLSSEEIINSKNLNKNVADLNLRLCHKSEEKECHNLEEIKREDLIIENNGQLEKIQIHICHNFSNIQGTVIDLWYEDIAEDPDQYWLQYEVLHYNKTIKMFYAKQGLLYENAKITSGPMGYHLNKPLIISKYIALNNSLPLSETNQIMEYFTNNMQQQNTLKIFKKHQGLCQQSNSQQKEFINFGINLAKQCLIRLENETLLEENPAKTNFTKICQKLQKKTQELLWGYDFNNLDHNTIYISQFGKPQNNSKKWLPLNVVNLDFSPVHGQYLENSHSFVCRNILLSLAYEFHSGSYDIPEANEQNMLKHARLIVGQRHDLEFAIDEVIEVPLSLTVRFYDINEISGAATCRLVLWWTMYFISLVLVL